MEKEFSSISELAKTLHEGVVKLENGGLALNDLEALSAEAAELHERLVVLKYKAYDELVKETENSSPPAIRISVPDNQINLIDVIAEEEQQIEPPIAANPELNFMPEPEVEKKVIEQSKPVEQIKATPNFAESKEAESAASLAEKLGKTAIQDLKKSIGLNQKFQFISDLFNGDNGSYDGFIQLLNSAQGKEQAFELLEDKRAELSWDEEDASYSQLADLVERRHL